MPFFDLPLEQLQTYTPERYVPADYDSFWDDTLQDTRSHALNAKFEPVDAGLRLVDTYDVTFSGFGGQRIKGWLVVPRHTDKPMACVVQYLGYSGGRGLAFNWLLWANAGYATLVMDTRGQGFANDNPGDTPDFAPEGDNPQVPGFMTRGILNPRTYYYRRVFTDAVRAVEAARTHAAIDPARIAIMGGSQGGGITLAVAGLVPDLKAVMPDVPFLCQYRRATTLVNTAPYNEITRFCATHRTQIDTVFNTLAYFDGVNFAPRANAPALFSVGLMDDICPPSTVYAAYNYYAGPKEMAVYEFNNHEGGRPFHTQRQIDFLHKHLG